MLIRLNLLLFLLKLGELFFNPRSLLFYKPINNYFWSETGRADNHSIRRFYPEGDSFVSGRCASDDLHYDREYCTIRLDCKGWKRIKVLSREICRSGGIGRRARLRTVWALPLEVQVLSSAQCILLQNDKKTSSSLEVFCLRT